MNMKSLSGRRIVGGSRRGARIGNACIFPQPFNFASSPLKSCPAVPQSGQNGETQKHHAHSKLLEPLVGKPFGPCGSQGH